MISGTQKKLKIEDALAMLKIPEVSRVAPIVRGGVQAKHGNRNTRPNLLETSASYFAVRS